MTGRNPENQSQRRVFFHAYAAYDVGEKRHPLTVMQELAERHGFRTLAAVPQSLFDGWDFWIEECAAPVAAPYLLDYPWKPIGQV